MCNENMLASDDIRAGLIPGITFGYRSVVYAVVDGMAIFEGCISLGTVEKVEQVTADIRRALEQAGDAERDNVANGVGITGDAFRWPDRVVPFTIDPTLTEPERVTEAIDHWRERTGFTFVERTNANASNFPNFVNFAPGVGCSSQVGMQIGGQEIILADGCRRGHVIREIGHAVGLWHEQSREDRD